MAVGPETKLAAEQFPHLSALVAATPDATLEELRVQMKKKARVEVSRSTHLSGLASAGADAKKKTKRASQADPHERAAFQEHQKTLGG